MAPAPVSAPAPVAIEAPVEFFNVKNARIKHFCFFGCSRLSEPEPVMTDRGEMPLRHCPVCRKHHHP